MTSSSNAAPASNPASSSGSYFKIPSEEDDAALDNVANGYHWNRREKVIWFFTLLAGTTACYASRTTMPLVAPAMSSDLQWSKTEVGTVLSSFFWGYALTQILGGYLSDKFGAERVILTAGLGWGFLTFWFHRVAYIFSDHDSAFNFIVICRVLLGGFQGVHFPAMASISSKNLNTKDRSFFFSFITSGSALGTLVTGSLGSGMNENFGWPSVFYTIGMYNFINIVCSLKIPAMLFSRKIYGFISLAWVGWLKYHAMEIHKQKRQILGLSSSSSLFSKGATISSESGVPWLLYLRQPSLWACIICHFCQNNCFFILLSWLPTYFHDNFPDAQSWIFNVVPWMLMLPGIASANLLTNELLSRDFSVTFTRKTCEAVCMGTELVCLLLIGGVTSFPLSLFLMSVCLFAASFHSTAAVVNPQDLAPKHSGSIFGIMNAAGAIPGFIGVYIAGYILEVTGSWAAVFHVTAVINLIGVAVFCWFGSSKPIV